MLPNEQLIAISKKFPNAWSRVDEFCQDSGKGLPKWPTWCLLPMAGWYAVVSEGNGVMQLTAPMAADVAKIAAIGTWRYSQGIYRFDDSLYSALITTEPSGDLPCDVFYRLPEWCIYVETTEMKWFDTPYHGFWCHLEWDVNTGRHELRLLLNCEHGELIAVPLHLGNWTLDEAIDRATQEAKKHAGDLASLMDFSVIGKMRNSLNGLISLVLYLCSDEPEIDDLREPGFSPKRPQPKKTKKGWQLFPAQKPHVWQVGVQFGKTLRQIDADFESASSGRSVKPHLRRAHWHGFWTGPRDGERKFHYKWLPPLLVAGN